MKRFFFATVFMILAIGVGWRYAPPDARERLLGFVGMANRADPARFTQEIKEKIMPEDPAARRAALVDALKQKMQEIKKDAGAGGNANGIGTPAGAADTRLASIAKTADEAAVLADQLGQSGGGASVGGQVMQRVLDRILPAVQCKEP